MQHLDQDTQLPDTLLPDTFLPPPTQSIASGGEGSLPSAASAKETSQQTPTQINDGRDYDKPYELGSSEHGGNVGDTQASNFEGRTLQEDDTGAVNFGSLIDFPRQSSQVSEDGGFENAHGGWRISEDTQQNSMNNQTPYKDGNAPPETPALPKNPFAQMGGVGVGAGAPAPFGGTQLFGQTQLLTSAVKNSPTSSRPSPNMYHSISPGFAETSPLKHRTNVSSPTDVRSSSPQRLHEVPATVMKGPRMSMITEETPTISRVTREDRIPESPTRPRSSDRQPLAHYEPMQQSQARKTSSDSVDVTMSFDGDVHDTVEQLERRKRIERKRARAGEELERITFARPAPTQNREDHSGKRRRLDEGSEAIATEPDQAPRATQNPEPTNATRQHPQSLESTKATPGEENEQAEEVDESVDTGAQDRGVADVTEYDMIPATSPMQLTPADDGNRGGTPASEPDLPILREDPPTMSSGEPSSLPPPNSRRTYGRQPRRARRNWVIDSSNSNVPSTAAEPSKPDATEHQPASRETIDDSTAEQTPMATRSRIKKHSPQTPASGDETVTTASSLSVLSRTPNPSSKTTPATKESAASNTRDVEAMQLTPSRSLRRRVVEKETHVPAPTMSSRSLRASRRLNGEPQSSGQPGTPSDHGGTTTSVRSMCQQIEPVYRDERHLFDGMMFAISVASEQGKQQTRGKLETRIVQAGGTVLTDGFQELFQSSLSMTSTDGTSDDNTELVLSQKGAESGFAALIADGHSRKAKYMQALALGLPCLAHQWITACLNKGALVDWQPYLLCAGASAVLGNAIRSRCLLPYAADAATLPDVIEQRQRLLKGQNVLVIMDSKKAKNEAKQPYIFLCQALGPAITRVSTTEQGRAALAEHAAKKNPFTWLYIDKSSGTPDAVLKPPAAASSKKKKKMPAVKPAWAKVRVLHDELIIQSLILGRIVEPEEEVF